MNRLIALAAMLAMALIAVAPAQATSFAAPDDQYRVSLCADGVEGGVCYDPTASVTCESFALEEEAQAFLDLGLGSESDREALDPDGNGIACDDPDDGGEVPESSTGRLMAAGMNVLPDTGGVAVLPLGVGALLVAGGVLLRKIFR